MLYVWLVLKQNSVDSIKVTDPPTCFSMTQTLFMPCLFFYPFLCKNINIQYIILKPRSSTINILILFLPEFNEILKEKDQKQLNLTKMKVFLKPNCLVQFHANQTINKKVNED